MTAWGNICRICSCQADYEVFAKIPTYLHTNSNEFINWQKPINVMLEEITGLKVSADDGLPKNICALCISYMKHAVNFRDQTLGNALSLKLIMNCRTVQNSATNINENDKAKIKQQSKHEDKESFLVTADDLAFTAERETDANMLLNNSNSVDQNKVNKKLLNNAIPPNMPRAPQSPKTMEQQMQYLNLLFNKHKNAGLNKRESNNDTKSFNTSTLNTYVDDDCQTATTSSEDSEDANAVKPKQNMFSYEEHNFEEDDITQIDGLREAISVNIPESCKERKCRACFRRYMFEDTYNEHTDTCIEHKFLTFIEDVNRLLEIRRSRAVSPHEYIRRMIFALRKVCEWLKHNCHDILLPDLLLNNAECNVKKRLESEEQSSSSIENKDITSNPNQQKQKREGASINKKMKKNLNKDLKIFNTTFETIKSNVSGTTTPINMNNNILYEIERTQSRQQIKNHEKTVSKQTAGQNSELQKPIALLGVNITNNNLTHTSNSNNNENGTATSVSAVLENVQNVVEKQPDLLASTTTALPATPLISVRKDLQMQQTQLCQTPTMPVMPRILTFSAHCSPCNLNFETLVMLELHNALYHNNLALQVDYAKNVTSQLDQQGDTERRRIIALFDESSGEEN